MARTHVMKPQCATEGPAWVAGRPARAAPRSCLALRSLAYPVRQHLPPDRKAKVSLTDEDDTCRFEPETDAVVWPRDLYQGTVEN